MRILVTGGRGFIGSYVVAAASAAGHDVVVLDRAHEISETLPAEVRDAVGRTRFFHADVRDVSVLSLALAGVDVVVHQAARVGLSEGVLEAADYVRDNDLATAVLLSAMQQTGVNNLVLASSMVVYGAGTGLCSQHGTVPVQSRTRADLSAGDFEPRCLCGNQLAAQLVDEECVLAPSNIYAATKVAQEHLATSWARFTGGSATALRYHNVYGPGLPRDTPYSGVAAVFVSALLNGEAPRVYEDGGQRRDFIHVRDIARANIAAIERCDQIQSRGSLTAYNVGSGQPRTIHEVASALSEALGGPAPVVTGEFRLGDVRHITASSRKLREEFRWSADEDFATGMEELSTVIVP